MRICSALWGFRRSRRTSESLLPENRKWSRKLCFGCSNQPHRNKHSPQKEDGEGGGSFSDADLGPETGWSEVMTGHQHTESLWLCGGSSESSNSRVCLLNVRSGPESLEWQVERWVLEGGVTSENDTWGLSLCLWSDALSCPRRLLSFLVSLLIGLPETLLDCEGAVRDFTFYSLYLQQLNVESASKGFSLIIQKEHWVPNELWLIL